LAHQRLDSTAARVERLACTSTADFTAGKSRLFKKGAPAAALAGACAMLSQKLQIKQINEVPEQAHC
jgi:hypothetical protein